MYARITQSCSRQWTSAPVVKLAQLSGEACRYLKRIAKRILFRRLVIAAEHEKATEEAVFDLAALQYRPELCVRGRAKDAHGRAVDMGVGIVGRGHGADRSEVAAPLLPQLAAQAAFPVRGLRAGDAPEEPGDLVDHHDAQRLVFHDAVEAALAGDVAQVDVRAGVGGLEQRQDAATGMVLAGGRRRHRHQVEMGRAAGWARRHGGQ